MPQSWQTSDRDSLPYCQRGVVATSGLVVSNAPQLAQNRDGLPLKTSGEDLFKDI
jgi:hypothetical protein